MIITYYLFLTMVRFTELEFQTAVSCLPGDTAASLQEYLNFRTARIELPHNARSRVWDLRGMGWQYVMNNITWLYTLREANL